MAKFPSLQSVFKATANTIIRFPLETLAAFVGTIFSLIIIDFKSYPVHPYNIKIVMFSNTDYSHIVPKLKDLKIITTP